MSEKAKTSGETTPLAKDDILHMAKWQKMCAWGFLIGFFSHINLYVNGVAVLLYVAFLYIQFPYLKNFTVWSYRFAIAACVVWGIWAAFSLLGNVSYLLFIVLFVVQVLFLYLSCFLLLITINQLLRANGVRVGIIGVNKSDLALLKSKP